MMASYLVRMMIAENDQTDSATKKTSLRLKEIHYVRYSAAEGRCYEKYLRIHMLGCLNP